MTIKRTVNYSHIESVRYTFEERNVTYILRDYLCESFDAKSDKGTWDFQWYEDDDGNLVIEIEQRFSISTDGVPFEKDSS